MRTREAKLSDYGVFPEDEKKLLRRCRESTREERQTLLGFCIKSAPEGLEVPVYESLVTGRSYDEIHKRDYIPAKKDDFYGYRRKAMGLFYDFLRVSGKI